MVRVLIVGSAAWTDTAAIERKLHNCRQALGCKDDEQLQLLLVGVAHLAGKSTDGTFGSRTGPLAMQPTTNCIHKVYPCGFFGAAVRNERPDCVLLLQERRDPSQQTLVWKRLLSGIETQQGASHRVVWVDEVHN
jgi:hypothetical protein